MEIKDILNYVTGMPRNNNINVLKTMLETLVEEYSIGDTGSIGVEDILEYVVLTPHNSNVNVLRTMLESLIGPEPVVEGEAYAVLADKTLTFFRDEPGKYTNGQTIDGKTYYTGIENGDHGWNASMFTSITIEKVVFHDIIKPIKTAGWFSSCSQIKEITNLKKLNTSNVTDMNSMFSDCTNLTSIDVSRFNTSNVTDMSTMFSNCQKLSSLNLSKFNTSNVTNMGYMFNGCKTLATLNVSNFNTSNVTRMDYMFRNCQLLELLNIKNFDTSEVTNMSEMFGGCSSLEKVDVSGFNTSSVTNMSGMFNGCELLSILHANHFDTSNVTDMYSIFNRCSSLAILHIGNFNTSNVTNMENTFAYCRRLSTLDVSNFDTSKVRNMRRMFEDCIGLESADLSGFDFSSATNMQGMLSNCQNLTTDIVINSTRYRPDMFYDAATITPAQITIYCDGSVTSQDIDNLIDTVKIHSPASNLVNGEKIQPAETEAYAVFDSADGSLVFFRDEPGKYSEGQVEDTKTYYTGVEGNGPFGWTDKRFIVTNVRFDDDIKPIKTESWFADCNNLISINMSNLDTSNVTDMSNMFNNCSALTSIDVSGFDTSNVVNMSNMFSSCSSLTSLNVSNFDTSKVTDMSYMFNDCVGLTSLNLSNFDTSNVVSMEGMFYNCSGLESLDITSFDTSNVVDMESMFSLCNSLASLDISNFDTSKVANMSYMFGNCYNLLSLDTSGFDMTEATNIEEMFWNCTRLTAGITLSKKSILSKNTFYQAATNPPAKITLYGEGDVTSDDIDDFIAEIKTDSPDSNIVNGMLSSNVVFDEDVVWNFEELNPPSMDVPLTPLIPIEDTDIDTNKYIIRITNPQMRKYLGGDPIYGEWLDAICTANKYIASADNRYVLSTFISYSNDKWAVEFIDAAGGGYAPTKFHLYVEKKD